ncbi:MAG: SH3 domain-containing protein [Thiovulaceae bacterium]|nr:SH3 domain-containing protein [Sulfurimonadaceae bacterium]
MHHTKALNLAILAASFAALFCFNAFASETSLLKESQALESIQNNMEDRQELEELTLSTLTVLNRMPEELDATKQGFCISPVYPHLIEDLYQFPQDIEVYAKKNALRHKRLYDVQNDFDKNYFSVWDYTRPPESSFTARWPFRVYIQGSCYGENLQLLASSWFDKMFEKANFKAFGETNRYGLTLHFASLRNFPTNKPLFKDPSLAGEGFPFDYLQNSAVHANEPIYISHYSKDRAWVYIYTSYASGWLPSYAIAFMDKKERKKWENSKPVYLLKEKVALADTEGHFLFYSRVGMQLSFIRKTYKYTYVRAVAQGAFNKPTFVTIKFDNADVTTVPLFINQHNLTKISADIMKENYGWGGLYEDRDCSSTLRDIFTPFGIWMPRNSRQQSLIGRVISFEDLNVTQKKRMIKEKAVPFETLLHRKGHIMLYLGTYDEKIMILHNMWGVKTVDENEKEGRVIIGKVVISTLEVGSKQNGYDYNSSLLPNLDRMNIFTYSSETK